MTDALSASLERLRRFSSTFNRGDMVDKESGLTADDLGNLIMAIDAQFGDSAKNSIDTGLSPTIDRDVPLSSVVIALAETVSRMARYYNSRLDGEPVADQLKYQKIWNDALEKQNKALVLLGKSHGLDG